MYYRSKVKKNINGKSIVDFHETIEKINLNEKVENNPQ